MASKFPGDYGDTSILVKGKDKKVDFVNHHGYFRDINNNPHVVAEAISYDLIAQHYSEFEIKIRADADAGNLPLLSGEFGLRERDAVGDGYDSVWGKKRYPTYIHYGVWAGLCSGLAGTPMKWSDGKEFGEMRKRPPAADGFTAEKYPYDLWKEYKAVGDFLKHDPKPNFSALNRNSNATTTNAGIKVFSLASTTTAIGYVYNSELTGDKVADITLTNFGAGAYQVLWFNPWSGVKIGDWIDAGVVGADKKLTFKLRSFAQSVTAQDAAVFVRDKNDIAFKIRKKP
jgi:hypothetical protein